MTCQIRASSKPLQRPHPPILIGAGGEKLGLRVVAQHADIWSCPARAAEEFRHKSQVLDEHCQAIGRDPQTIVRSMQVIVSRDDPEEARRRLIEFIGAGCTHLAVAPRPPCPPATAAWIAAAIIEPVLAQTSARDSVGRRPA